MKTKLTWSEVNQSVRNMAKFINIALAEENRQDLCSEWEVVICGAIENYIQRSPLITPEDK